MSKNFNKEIFNDLNEAYKKKELLPTGAIDLSIYNIACSCNLKWGSLYNGGCSIVYGVGINNLLRLMDIKNIIWADGEDDEDREDHLRIFKKLLKKLTDKKIYATFDLFQGSDCKPALTLEELRNECEDSDNLLDFYGEKLDTIASDGLAPFMPYQMHIFRKDVVKLSEEFLEQINHELNCEVDFIVEESTPIKVQKLVKPILKDLDDVDRIEINWPEVSNQNTCSDEDDYKTITDSRIRSACLDKFPNLLDGELLEPYHSHLRKIIGDSKKFNQFSGKDRDILRRLSTLMTNYEKLIPDLKTITFPKSFLKV